jgi:hypothetical protein
VGNNAASCVLQDDDLSWQDAKKQDKFGLVLLPIKQQAPRGVWE